MYKIICHSKNGFFDRYFNSYLILCCSKSLRIIKKRCEFYSKKKPDCVFEIVEFETHPTSFKEIFKK